MGRTATAEFPLWKRKDSQKRENYLLCLSEWDKGCASSSLQFRIPQFCSLPKFFSKELLETDLDISRCRLLEQKHRYNFRSEMSTISKAYRDIQDILRAHSIPRNLLQ